MDRLGKDSGTISHERRPYRQAAALLLNYEWEEQDLIQVGMPESEFLKLVAKLRKAALDAGWVEIE